MSKIDKVIDYLYETDGDFIDKAMIQIAEHRDNMIIQEMNRVCAKINIGVYVDEVKLKKWVQMCAELEQLSYEAQKDLAIKAEIIGLKSKISKLEWENLQLKETIDSLRKENSNLKNALCYVIERIESIKLKDSEVIFLENLMKELDLEVELKLKEVMEDE